MGSAAQPPDLATEESAVVALYRAEAPTMVRLATLLTGDPQVAEDLVHDAFLRIHARIATVSSPGGYLRTTVVNLCRDHGRHLKVIHSTPQPRPGAVEMSLPEDLGATWAAIHRLPARQREAVVLRYYLDLSDPDIAAHLSCRPGTVRSLISRALSTLRKDLE